MAEFREARWEDHSYGSFGWRPDCNLDLAEEDFEEGSFSLEDLRAHVENAYCSRYFDPEYGCSEDCPLLVYEEERRSF